MRILASLLALTFSLAAQQQQQQQERDLKFEKPVKKRFVAPSIPRSYALVIGISRYENLAEASQLAFPERDAESIYSVLISLEAGNFHAENVHRLIGAKATLANIRKELEEWLPAVTKDDDRVLIYFAGHGFVHGGRAYLAPYDISRDDIPGTGYPMDDLGQVFGSKIKGKWKVMLTDACHSGAITPGEDAAFINNRILDLNKSIFSFTASRDREVANESVKFGGGHGVFTYYVVKGLEGLADQSKDGIVTADELVEYVRPNVRQATENKQNPTSDRGSFDPEMLLSYVASGIKPDDPPPAKFGTLILESNMDGVEIFVNDKSMGIVDKGKPLTLPGLPHGIVNIKGVRMGYEPDGPREEMVRAGEDTTVSIKISIPRRRPKAAVDKFDDGMEQYNKGDAESYRKAASFFDQALAIDPKYSQAALYQGRVYDALFEQEKAVTYYKRAIEIDPDYLEARASYGGMLLGMGNDDEALRQFNIVTIRDKNNQLAYYLQAQAYQNKGLFNEAVDSARRAIQLAPNNAEAHFVLAENLRRLKQSADSSAEYETYLRLSDFDSKFAGKFSYYVVGSLVGFGKKKRAAQTDIWKDQRNMAYFGLCENAKNRKQYQVAIGYCQRAISYDPEDAFSHYLLGLNYAYLAKETGSLEMLAAARQSFERMLALNPDLAEADFARKNVAAFELALKSR